jgi:hypothetical protein
MVLAIDLFCGLGGWTEGLLAEGYDVVGFDIERHEYGEHRYPAQLVIQDVLTLHGRQFKDAALIVASPPCQAYSYRAMPWKRAKALPPPDNSLFDACFRIQREACEAAGRHIPLVVENVRGAQKWVGRSRWNFGSFHLWGDVPALMPMTTKRGIKVGGTDLSKVGFNVACVRKLAHGDPSLTMEQGRKNNGGSWFNVAHNTTSGHGQNPDGRLWNGAEYDADAGLKMGGDWFSDPTSTCRRHGSKSQARKRASAMIAKIPLPLSRYIAAVYRPGFTKAEALAASILSTKE